MKPKIYADERRSDLSSGVNPWIETVDFDTLGRKKGAAKWDDNEWGDIR
jgi:hypothetical protein